MRRWPLIAAGPAAVVGLLGVQVAIVMNRDYLPSDTGYEVEATVQPPSPSNGPGALRLVVLGDSTAAGVGSPTADQALPVLIAERVAEATGRPVKVTGFGVSGSRTADVTAEQLPLIEATGADAVVIVIGSNDVTHVTPPWVLADQTREMLRAARRAGVPVILGGIPLFEVEIFPQPLRWAVGRIASLQRWTQERAAADVDGVTLVPIAREASPRFVGVPDAMSDDGYHPGPVGYGFWADALARGVRRALASTT